MLDSLQRLGHQVETLAVFDNVTTIVEKLKACAPDIVFNLTESFHHDRSHEPNIPALLELMKVRYTGAGPEGLLLCKDKALAKKVLAYHRVRLPRFVVSHQARPVRGLAALQVPGVRQAGGRRVVRWHRQSVLRSHAPRKPWSACATSIRSSNATC